MLQNLFQKPRCGYLMKPPCYPEFCICEPSPLEWPYQMTQRYLKDTLSRRLVFFTGKGGVGKSAVAWATAKLLKDNGKNVLFLSWSPFDKNSSSNAYQLPGIEVLALNATECFKEYALNLLKFERIYDAIFENKVLKTFVQAAPGLSETVVAGKIWNLFSRDTNNILIVDLPASGHAFSFFQSPLGIQKLFSLGFVHNEALKIAEMFQHPRTRLDFVAIPEDMSLTETREFHIKLKALHPFSFGFLHINQCLPKFTYPEEGILRSLPTEIETAIHRFQIQAEHEAVAIESINDLPFPKILIPKFGTENASPTIEKMTEVLSHS